MSNQPYSTIVRLSKMGISATATGATTIGTTENGTERFYPLFAVVVVASATAISVVGTLSIGTNSSSYNNIVAATATTGLTAVNAMLKMDVATAVGSIAANTDVKLNISVGFTASAATIDVHLFGFYQ